MLPTLKTGFIFTLPETNHYPIFSCKLIVVEVIPFSPQVMQYNFYQIFNQWLFWSWTIDQWSCLKRKDWSCWIWFFNWRYHIFKLSFLVHFYSRFIHVQNDHSQCFHHHVLWGGASSKARKWSGRIFWYTNVNQRKWFWRIYWTTFFGVTSQFVPQIFHNKSRKYFK